MSALPTSPPNPFEIRRELTDLVFRDLHGPAGGPEEEVAESTVRDRYLVGMLALYNQQLSPEEFDELAEAGADTLDDGVAEPSAPPARTMFPSSFGMSLLQQFQRAAALLCACEVIRRDAKAKGDSRWGETPFRIGLWVGQKTTPNQTDDAAEVIARGRGNRDFGSTAGVGTPHQLTNCPWCGTKIDPGQHIKVEKYPGGHARTLIFCGDPRGECPFTPRQAPAEGLPVVVVDEEIYRRLPAMIIATVDKFAQMPWNGKVQMLFGQVQSYCDRHGFRSSEVEDADSHNAAGGLPRAKSKPVPLLRPPDLIIQDELHLISGPLGTLVGLYETAIDRLCCWEVDGKTVRPR